MLRDIPQQVLESLSETRVQEIGDSQVGVLQDGGQ